MRRFKYETMNFPGNFHSMLDFLNQRGADGWELVAADNFGFNTICIFKREVPEEEQGETLKGSKP
jgi:hypothetical protein